MTLPPRIAIIIIVLFHVVGLIGFAIPASRPLFLQIVPFHLLLMLLVVILSHNKITSGFGVFVIIIFWLGFIAEWIGVHKGWLFGHYTYGETLGLKLSGIPLMIGVNWFLLIYAAGVTMQRSRLKNAFFRISTGAVILVILDLLIEPVAIHFDYWQWQERGIPLSNYVCWFLVSAFLLYIFELFRFKKQSMAAPVLLAVEFIFFGILTLVL